MKTTTTTNTVNTTAEILKAFKGANGSFITIEPGVIEEAIQAGDLVQIAERQGRKGGNNTYYSCSKLGDNTVLMHVKNNMYTTINRYVYCESLNRRVDVIPVLTQFSFCSGLTTSNRCSIMAGTPVALKKQGFSATLYFTRVIASIEKYGELRPLASDYDVHHKSDCWDNRQYMIMYILSSLHNHRNNHMTGRNIRSYSDFMWLCNYLEAQYTKLHNETKIA